VRGNIQLKRARDSVSTLVAQVVHTVPALHRPYAVAAFACSHVPGVHTLFREATRQLSRQLRDSGRNIRSIRIGDVVMNFDVTDFTVQGCYFSRVPYEPGATSLVLALAPGQVFVDIGANSGYFTILAGSRVGRRGRVFAFEPNPVVKRRLQRHVDVNHLSDRVEVSSLAITDRDADDVSLFISCRVDNSGLSSLVPSDAALNSGELNRDVKVPVRTSRFDSWMRGASVTRIDLIKIDVEGAELSALHGMRRTLERLRPRKIICETSRNGPAAVFLHSLGYRVSEIDAIPGGVPNLLFEVDHD
jgi:FkbM family methyltransferase